MTQTDISSLDATALAGRVERFRTVRGEILAQVGQVIVGQDEVLDQILTALLVGGHCLITGLPGTAKTLMVRTIAQTLGLVFSRSSSRPTSCRRTSPAPTSSRTMTPVDGGAGPSRPGPLFGNVVLADEINRTPPKTQSALLEAMQEHSCTVRGTIHQLPAPFFVLATQNPIELEGTYPLPEAQLDRFLFNTALDYLGVEHEVQVIARTTSTQSATIATVTSAAELLEFQQLIRMVPVSDAIARHVVRVVRATRFKSEESPRDHPSLRELWRKRPRGAVHRARRQGPRLGARPIPCRLR